MRKGSEKSMKEPDSSLVTQRHCALGQQSGFPSPLSTEARTAAAALRPAVSDSLQPCGL